MKIFLIIFKIIIFMLVSFIIFVFYTSLRDIKLSQLKAEHNTEIIRDYVSVVEGKKLIDPDEYFKK